MRRRIPPAVLELRKDSWIFFQVLIRWRNTHTDFLLVILFFLKNKKWYIHWYTNKIRYAEKWSSEKWSPEKWSPGKMVPGKMVLEKNGPWKNGPREKWFPENWSLENWSPEKCSRVLGFHRLITSQHSTHTHTHTLRCSKPTQRFFVPEFSGDHFSGDKFSRDQFSGDHFSRGPFFRGPFFSGTVFPRTIFQGDFFSGAISPGTIFPGFQNSYEFQLFQIEKIHSAAYDRQMGSHFF